MGCHRLDVEVDDRVRDCAEVRKLPNGYRQTRPACDALVGKLHDRVGKRAEDRSTQVTLEVRAPEGQQAPFDAVGVLNSGGRGEPGLTLKPLNDLGPVGDRDSCGLAYVHADTGADPEAVSAPEILECVVGCFRGHRRASVRQCSHPRFRSTACRCAEHLGHPIRVDASLWVREPVWWAHRQ
jgi:hypothetical protein